MTTKLHQFEGHDVISTRISVTNAGDGLSEAMQVDPVELSHGGKVFLVMEAEVAKVRFDPSKDDADALIRVHVLRASTATMVGEDLVADVLAEQREKNRKWRDEQDGKLSLDLDGDDDELDDDDPAADADDELDPPADPDDADWEASGRAAAEPVAEEPPATDDVATARRRRATKKAAGE